MNIAQNWRLNGQRYALIGSKDEQTGTVQLAAREVIQTRFPQLYKFENPTLIELHLPVVHELRQAAR